MTENGSVNPEEGACVECACECGLVCECLECACPNRLDKDTAALVAEFSSDQREKGC